MRAIPLFALIFAAILLPVLKAYVDANEKKRSPMLYADHWRKRSLDIHKLNGFQARAEKKPKKQDVEEDEVSALTTSSSSTTRSVTATSTTKPPVQTKKPSNPQSTTQQKQPSATTTSVEDTNVTTSIDIAQPSDVASQDGPDNQLNGQQRNNPSQNDQNIPAGNTVPTESNSTGIILVATVGCVFVAAFGLFAFVRKKKRQEMAESIVATSASAWEKQTDIYQKVDENPVKSYTVIKTYIPTLSDELDIQLGDKVTILEVYDDGWVQGINETRGGEKGVFPLNCVDMNVSPNNKRSSSVGAYTVVDLN